MKGVSTSYISKEQKAAYLENMKALFLKMLIHFELNKKFLSWIKLLDKQKIKSSHYGGA